MDDAIADHATVLTFVDTDAPAESVLLTKAAGQDHVGGERFAMDSNDYNVLFNWIEAGAAP